MSKFKHDDLIITSCDYNLEDLDFTYPRVTKVLNYFPNPSLEKWRKSLGDDVADFEMKRCATRGTQVHEMIEEYLYNKKVYPRNVLANGLFGNMINYLDLINNIRCIEHKLVSHDLKLQGRVDCIAEVNGSLAVIDFKTSNSPTEKPRTNYLLQCTAYALMYEELYQEKIKDIIIIVADEKGGSKMFRRELSEYEDRFKKLLIKYYEAINNE